MNKYEFTLNDEGDVIVVAEQAYTFNADYIVSVKVVKC